MSAGKYNFTIEQGATFDELLIYKDDSGALVDLTGYSARMQVRVKITDAQTLISLTDTAGITLGGATGTIHLFISDIDTAALPITNAVYDLELVDATGVVTRLLEGAVSLSPEVTR